MRHDTLLFFVPSLLLSCGGTQIDSAGGEDLDEELSSAASKVGLFHNTGTTSGWDYILHEHSGSALQVSNVTYKDSTALKFTQIYDPNYNGRYHSEVGKNDAYRRGDSGFYGFAFRLKADWQVQN